MSAPAWAERIVRDVARARGRRPPELHWRRSRHRQSAGSALGYAPGQENVISIEAGRDPVDQRLAVCHELAHWLGKPDEGHTSAFWRRAWKLYRRYRVPIYYALAREGEHEGAVLTYASDRKKRQQAP